MEFKALKMYFKAAVLVPFYTMCFFVIVVLLVGVTDESILRVTLYSGLTGLAATTIFLNYKRSIAFHFLYNLLSFYLLPMLFMAFVLLTDVNWHSFRNSGEDMIFTCVLFSIFFMHLIGLSISYIDFRRSIIQTIEEEEKAKRNQLRTIYDDQLPYA